MHQLQYSASKKNLLRASVFNSLVLIPETFAQHFMLTVAT